MINRIIVTLLQFSKEHGIHPFVVSDLLFVNDGTVLWKDDIITEDQMNWVVEQIANPEFKTKFPQYFKLNSDLPWNRPSTQVKSFNGVFITCNCRS
jgi:hypothetical protein